MTARRSSRSTRTAANGPTVKVGTARSAKTRPTAATLCVSWLMYTARAMNVTKLPTSEIHSASQTARSSGRLRTPKTRAASFRERFGMGSIIGAARNRGRACQVFRRSGTLAPATLPTGQSFDGGLADCRMEEPEAAEQLSLPAQRLPRPPGEVECVDLRGDAPVGGEGE